MEKGVINNIRIIILLMTPLFTSQTVYLLFFYFVEADIHLKGPFPSPPPSSTLYQQAKEQVDTALTAVTWLLNHLVSIITVIKILIEFCSLNSFKSHDVNTLVTKPFCVPSIGPEGLGDTQLNAYNSHPSPVTLSSMPCAKWNEKEIPF